MIKKYVIYSILVALVYAFVGILGLKLAVPPGYASAVFPSSGIALAALLLLGRHYALSIFIGSAIMNFFVASQSGSLTSSSILIAFLIGAGASLQALIGEVLIKKYVPKFENLNDEKSIMMFLLLAGPASCVVNATFSTTVLSVFGVLSGTSFFYNWGMWFVGDAIGAMVFAPLVLAMAEKPRFSWSPKKRLVAVPSLLLFSFVVWFFFYSSNQLSEKFKAHLHIESDRHSQRISEAMDKYEAILAGTERFFNASNHISRQEFRDYLYKVLATDQGIRAISWSPRVSWEEREKFEKNAKSAGIKNFKITEFSDQGRVSAKQRPFYYPVLYTEPLQSNATAVGFDAFSTFERRQAMEKSISLKQPAISSKIRIVQDNFQAPSLAMYYPIFQNNKNLGFIIGVFNLEDLINAALREDKKNADLNYIIYDVSDLKQELLFKKIVKEEEHLYSDSALVAKNILKNQSKPLFNSKTIEVGKRKWLLYLFPSKRYIAANADLTAWSMLLGGLFIVILLQSLMMVIIGRTATVERLVEQKTTELSNANIELEKLTKLKSAFLANMSHEIRTPINGVVGMTGLLGDTELNIYQRECVDNISISAKSLLSLINDILDFSKVEAGKLDLEIIDFDLEKTVRSTVKTLDYVARRKQLKLHVELFDMPSKVLRGDPSRFSQVLINLLNNAVKFTASGSVKLKASSLGFQNGVNVFRFEVIDTGIGIDPSAIERIFNPFDQVDTSFTRKYGGTGLGLSICKNLTELMGGKIGVIRNENGGSTFWVEFPFRESITSVVDSRRADEIPLNLSHLGLRVLLAEDNQINQLVAMKQLQKLGCHCDVVANGQEAIEALRHINYDLVLMDCQMPELDGYQATRQIRASIEKFSAIPIVAMTAHAMKGDREKCLEAGMSDYITKPISTFQLSEVIATWAKSSIKAG